MDSIIVAFGVLVVIIVVLAIFFSFFPVGLWISALASGVKIRISTLVGMRIRRITPSRLVYPLIKATKAGLDVSIDKMEAHYLAGGNIDRVINALIAAQRADIDLVFERAAAIDLAGRDVLQAVQMSVNPKVIETPVVAAIAKDGIELRAKARVTVRANIDRLVGGAGEETVIARVGEGIVTTVGSAESHKQVLENPDMISRTVLSKGLDAGTAFEILSIDIADVEELELQDASCYGRGFAQSGGVTAAIAEALKELGHEDFEFKPVIANGVEECRAALLKAKVGKLDGNFIEGMICEGGCVRGNGTMVNKKNTPLHLKQYCEASARKTLKSL